MGRASQPPANADETPEAAPRYRGWSVGRRAGVDVRPTAPAEPPPTRSAVQVAAPPKGAHIEIEATARR
jgi:hypothetical protein